MNSIVTETWILIFSPHKLQRLLQEKLFVVFIINYNKLIQQQQQELCKGRT